MTLRNNAPFMGRFATRKRISFLKKVKREREISRIYQIGSSEILRELVYLQQRNPTKGY